jgi:uncharacterized integral membrane protein
MRFRGILLTVVVLLVAIVVLNWAELVRPVPIYLLVVTWEGPLGLVLLLASVALAVLFFLAALLDRASQLRQVTQLDRQLQAVRSKLGAREREGAERFEGRLDGGFAELKGQLSALKETLDGRIGSASVTLESRMAERFEALDASLRDTLASMEARDKERSDTVLDRVARVRNELAADVAQTEDALARLVRPGDAEGEGA